MARNACKVINIPKEHTMLKRDKGDFYGVNPDSLLYHEKNYSVSLESDGWRVENTLTGEYRDGLRESDIPDSLLKLDRL